MLRDTDLTADLGRISSPTLVVHGAEDPLAPLTRAVLAGIRDARGIEIADAGHLPNLDQPAAFNKDEEIEAKYSFTMGQLTETEKANFPMATEEGHVNLHTESKKRRAEDRNSSYMEVEPRTEPRAAQASANTSYYTAADKSMEVAETPQR